MKHKRRNAMAPYVVLIILAVIFAIPLIWVVLASFDLNAGSSVKWPTWTMENYINVLSSQTNQRAFLNGLLISLGQSIIVVVVAILTAYPLSRYELRYKKIFMTTILFLTALPVTALMVPVYKYFQIINLYNKIGGVILFLSATSLPYAVWMMKNFMDSVPLELEEAAHIDGCSTLRGLFRIVLPLMFPGLCVVFIYTFSGSWGNFFVPYILLNSAETMPASVQLYQFFGSNGTVVYGQLAAYSVLYAIPALVLYVISQRWMSKGFNLGGAAKG
ncbi:MAG: carbohydrate ABC transporter permease [Clostridiales bacterium]|nr:carbohydrate ABC transporter permease [Clostridiales bacterium]